MMSADNPFDSLLAEHDGEDRWAFGTGFTDPLAGVDSNLPSDVDGMDLASYCAMLGDDALILAQRLIEWCTRAPELEEEAALANIGLDLLGQARFLLARAGQAEGNGRGEDRLAFFRDETQFRNVRLVELANGDFAQSVARLLVFSCWRLALFDRLADSRDPVLAAVAAKGVPELTYHRDYAAQWTLRLGGGTAYSHDRMARGLDAVWPFVAELFETHPVEERLAACGVAVAPAGLRSEVDEVLDRVLAAADLPRPQAPPRATVGGRAGRDGVHTEQLGYLLAEMQSLARAHPDASW